MHRYLTSFKCIYGIKIQIIFKKKYFISDFYLIQLFRYSSLHYFFCWIYYWLCAFNMILYINLAAVEVPHFHEYYTPSGIIQHICAPFPWIIGSMWVTQPFSGNKYCGERAMLSFPAWNMHAEITNQLVSYPRCRASFITIWRLRSRTPFNIHALIFPSICIQSNLVNIIGYIPVSHLWIFKKK